MKAQILLAFALFMGVVVWTTPAKAQKTENRTLLSVNSNSSDGSGETTIEYMEDGRRHKIRLNGSRITEIYVDDKKIPAEDFSKYEPSVKKILAQVEKDREQARKDREQAELHREQARKDREQAELHREQADKDRAQAEKDRQQADKDREQARQHREEAERNRKQLNEEREKMDKHRADAEQHRKQAELDRKQAEKDREQAQRDREQAQRDREQAAKDRARAEEDRKLFEAMIDELVKEKLLDSREALSSLELTETTLTINGKEQAANIHSRYKEKYLKNKNNRMMYRNSGGNRNLSFD